MSKDKIIETVKSILPQVTELRHTIHQNPELAGKEFKTSELIRKTLSGGSIKLLDPFLETDVVGILEGEAGDGGNVTLRADIDALPLQENTGVEYASQTQGCMHACGHDGHTAMLLGAALALEKLKSEFKGSVRFVFQPGEEIAALGKDLVDAGALLNPEPEIVCALHGFSKLSTGTLSTKAGAVMAAAGFFTVKIKGKGGHGSMPHLSINPINTACRIVESLKMIPAELVNPHIPAVVSVCRIEGGTNGNIIPDSAEIEGTTRFLDKKTGNKIPVMMEKIISDICDTVGAEYEFKYELPYIPTVNDPKVVDFAKDTVGKYLGEENWQDLKNSSMGGEDFSFYLDKYPGILCQLGMGKDSVGLHNPEFDFNDEALFNGIVFMAASVIEHSRK
ncbi:MAG: M20 metallopeptidase family protein [Planctomycetota bacterium]|jgi:amidohydrolase